MSISMDLPMFASVEADILELALLCRQSSSFGQMRGSKDQASLWDMDIEGTAKEKSERVGALMSASLFSILEMRVRGQSTDEVMEPLSRHSSAPLHQFVANTADEEDEVDEQEASDRVMELPSSRRDLDQALPFMSSRSVDSLFQCFPPAEQAKSSVPSPPATPVSHQATMQTMAANASVESESPREPQVGRKRAVGSGLHVKDHPEMSKRARTGQKIWSEKVKALREEWQGREDCCQDAAYVVQVEACAAKQIKSQHECLLLTLQIAAKDGVITPMSFADARGESFLGWSGFTISQSHAQEFRGRLDSLFPAPLQENTLHTSFRRAGLVPARWSDGWLGITPFVYSAEKRASYGCSRAHGG